MTMQAMKGDNAALAERRRMLVERFEASIKSSKTARTWLFTIHRFMRYSLCASPLDEPKEGDDPKYAKKFRLARVRPCEYHYELLIDFFTPEQLQEMLTHFVMTLKKPGHPSVKPVRAASIENYLTALQHFFWIHGKKGIDWDIIRSFKGEHVKAVSDREYYDEEIVKALAKTDERGRVAIRLQRQSGVRVGADVSLNIEDLKPIHLEGIGKLCEITVYKGTKEEYTTYGHPELVAELDSYFEYRMRYGEVCRQFGVDHYHSGKHYDANDKHLDPKSPVIREMFDKRDNLAARHPKRITEKAIADSIRDAMVAAGVRSAKLPEGQDRHEVMVTHGLRKAFKKKCRQAKVDPILLEYLMGHKSGNSREGITKLMMTYDPEDKNELLAEFCKAVNHLSLSESHKLKQEVKAMKEVIANAAPKDLVADLTMTNKALMEKVAKMEEDNKRRDAIMADWRKGKLEPDPNPRP